MSTVIRNHVELRGHTRDLAPLLKGSAKCLLDGVEGTGWDVSVGGAYVDWQTVEFFSKFSPHTDDVAALSQRHPRVLIEWRHFHAEGMAEGIVVASGGKVRAAGWWYEPHMDGDSCDDIGEYSGVPQ